ncbi:nucleoporin 88-like [Babylonia areolata]|uniref:nucleoporin 88-like n=1 Tax=Babylonia areolata TaxID=304850 RepID=UPI003FD1ECFD
MAMSGEDCWRDKLKVHPICKRLKESFSKQSPHATVGHARSLVAIKNGDLFVWDSYNANIVHCNLKSLVSVSHQKDGSSNHFQVLVCTDTPRFEVEGVVLNACGSHLALWGPRGIRVLELPQRWGKHSEFEGGKDIISCKTVRLATRHLAGSQWLQVRHVTWHPGSSTDTHLAVLTSDNIFSVYSLTEPEHPESTTRLQAGEMTSSVSPSKFNISMALGETAVAFTFGPPQELQPVKRPFQVHRMEDAITVWPVYFIKGNGDVMVTYSEVVSNRPLQLPTQGPLLMCPPAEDNYGVDACSVLCLDTTPPVLVMATCDGRLHHCLLLPSSSPTNKELTVAPELPKFYHPSQPLLYVVESVELELSLTDGNLDPVTSTTLSEDHFTCPIKIIKDPVSMDRYHCCHSAGVHSVALPWVHTLRNFLSNDSCQFVLPADQESVVEHLICTKPLYSSPVAPVFGMDIVSDPTLTPTLLVLTMDQDFTAMPMSNKYRNPWSGLLRDSESSGDVAAAPHSSSTEPFSQHIARILHRSVSNPLLVTKQQTVMSQQACYQLLMRVTQVLREEYVQKQELAQQEVDTRVRILTEQKKEQLADLQSLEETKEKLRDKAGILGERLQSCHDNQEDILRRLENIMRKIQSRVPLLSLAEKQMHSELMELKDKAEEFSKNIVQLRSKQEYQQRQMSQQKSSTSSPSTHLRQQQVQHIKEILREEGDEIALLMKQVSQLKMETDL